MDHPGLWIFATNTMYFDFIFDSYRKYLRNSKNMIDLQNEAFDKKFKEFEIANPNENDPDFYDVYEKEINALRDFPIILNKSMYLTIYSSFETYLVDKCNSAGHYVNSKLEVNDINESGGYISQCQKYLKKVVGLDLDEINIHWKDIKHYQTIRNKVAHQNNTIKRPNENLIKFINDKDGVRLYTLDSVIYNIVINDIKFLEEFIKVLEKYFDGLTKILMTQLNK